MSTMSTLQMGQYHGTLQGRMAENMKGGHRVQVGACEHRKRLADNECEYDW